MLLAESNNQPTEIHQPTKQGTHETNAGKSEAQTSGLVSTRHAADYPASDRGGIGDIAWTFDNVKTLDGRRAMIRNGYLPEREIAPWSDQ